MTPTLLLATALTLVQPPAPPTPEANPTTQPAPTTRPRLVIPPGFVRLDLGHRRFLIHPADETWVRRAADAAPPATRPTTLPADLVRNVESRRDNIITLLAADLDVPPQRIQSFLDNDLLPTLRDFDQSNIATVALVATRQQIRAALDAGWSNPAIRHTPGTDDILFSQVMVVPTDPDSADALVPFLVLPDQPEPDRIAKLAQELANLDESILRARSQRAQFLLQATLVRFIGSDILGELNLPPDTEWIAAGITGTLTAKYTSALSGVPRRTVIEAMTAEPRRSPPGFVHAASIDLLNPLDISALRPGALLPYADAVRRKSVAAIDHLLFLHTDAVLPKLLQSIRTAPPATSPDLVARIRDLTGTDLSDKLRPVR